MLEVIKDGESLVSACYRNSRYAIKTYDDGFGPLWISRNSIGINGIVRAQTWEDAYDEFFPEASETILNHGIYSKDLNGDSLYRLTQAMLDDMGIELTIEFDSEDETDPRDSEACNPNDGGVSEVEL